MELKVQIQKVQSQFEEAFDSGVDDEVIDNLGEKLRKLQEREFSMDCTEKEHNIKGWKNMIYEDQKCNIKMISSMSQYMQKTEKDMLLNSEPSSSDDSDISLSTHASCQSQQEAVVVESLIEYVSDEVTDRIKFGTVNTETDSSKPDPKDETEEMCLKVLKKALNIEFDSLVDYVPIVIDHPILSIHFMCYMKRLGYDLEFRFLKTVRNFRNYPSVTTANEIYLAFILMNEIGIPMTLSRKILQDILDSNIDENLFMEIEDLMVNSLNDGVFSSFVSSREFFEFVVDKTEEERGLRKYHESYGYLFSAIEKRDIGGFLKLMNEGFPVTCVNDNEDTLLLAATRHNCVPIAEAILNCAFGRKLLNKKNLNGEFPLSVAVMEKNRGMVKLLLSRGCNVNQTGEKGTTSFHLAATMNDMKIIAMLIEGGANLDLRNTYGYSVIDLATKKGAASIYQLQLEILKQRSLLTGHFEQWSEIFSVGIPLFDSGNKRLLHHLCVLNNHVVNKDGAGIDEICMALADYAKIQFICEEKNMVYYSYDEYKSHRKQHCEFKKRIQGALEGIRKNKGIKAKSLQKFIEKHFLTHICFTDKQYTKFFENKKILCSGSML